MHIEFQGVRSLRVDAETALLDAALAKKPTASGVRLRLADLAYTSDAFGEAIALLVDHDAGALDVQGLLLLAAALLARDAKDDLDRADRATAEAVARAPDDRVRAHALALRAKVLLRREEPDAAMVLLQEALRRDPQNVAAFKRLATELLREGRSQEVLDLIRRVSRSGAAHARLLAARTLALAALYRTDEARATMGIPEFLRARQIDPPAGWNSLAAFNASLLEELRGNPARRYDRHGTASKHTWRIDDPVLPGAPAAEALVAAIARTASAWMQGFADADHPWIATRPDRGRLRCWCVITGSEGHEQWHTHPDGWLSGGYYAAVPDEVATGQNDAGCLALGVPDGLIGAAAARRFGETLVRPRPGLLTLFPSHAYHRTYPHGNETERVCIAFDIVPA